MKTYHVTVSVTCPEPVRGSTEVGPRVSLPPSAAGAEPIADLPGELMCLDAQCMRASLPSLASRESCLSVFTVEKYPASSACSQQSPEDCRGWEFSASHQVAAGNARSKTASLLLVLKL